MKKILIVSPHFPPSNLAAVHRSRLFAQHLPLFGWSPIILTVSENFYEEELDRNLEKILPKDLRIEKVDAFKVSKPRIIGDIGLRGFFQLYKRAKSIIENEGIDFLYIPIPSFYVALLGRWLNARTGVKYGIDYIDPWVHEFAGSEKLLSRYWLSTHVSKLLEPIAVKKASLITGVAEGYYKGVQERNPHLLNRAVFAAMPYGGEVRDHEQVKKMAIAPYLFQEKKNKVQLVYAGAMLPKAYTLLEAIFETIATNKVQFESIEFHFIGTGKSPNDPIGYNIKSMAEKYGLWQTIVFEYPKRIPYLDVLVHLQAADGVFILGSTEPHYSPSKVYQAVLSNKPILAVLHQSSAAVEVLKDSGAGMLVEADVEKIKKYFPGIFQEYISWMKSFKDLEINTEAFDQYSAEKITEKLAKLLNAVI